MRKLKVGLIPRDRCADSYQRAPHTYDGEITELFFSDGHTVRAITTISNVPDCSGCYIREYSFNMVLEPVCPRVPDVGCLTCVGAYKSYKFICLEKVMEDI